MNGFFACIACFFFTGLAAFADSNQTAEQALAPYQSQIEAGPNENFDYAAVQLWMPAAPEKVRGILCVILHPLGQGGSTLARPLPWIKLAREENCALMSVSFAQSDDPTRDWCRAEQGTGRALLASLSDIARQSDVPALSSCPLVVVGVCAAGQFAFDLAAFAPTRVASFVTIGGGKHDLSKFKATASHPALLVATPDRGTVAAQNLRSLYAEGESFSAPWQFASEPIAKYDAGFCSSRVILYLRQRLATLASSAAARVGTNSNSGINPNFWVPNSICGMKLPPQIIVEPSTVAIGTINSSAGFQTLPFILTSAPGSPVNSVFAIRSDEAFQPSVQNIGPGRWHLACRINPEKLPLGPFKLLIKIRFEVGKKQVFGGAKADLTGIIVGPVNWHPLTLNFGSTERGQTSTGSVEIISNDGSPVQIEEVTSPFPWISTTERRGLKSLVIKCTLRAPSNEDRKGFAGYFLVKLHSPIRQSLKIFCYGNIQ